MEMIVFGPYNLNTKT